MQKRIVVFLLVVLLVCSIFVGCQETAKPVEKPAEKVETEKTDTKDEEAKQEKNMNPVQFTYWGSTYEKNVVEAALTKFHEETGYEVEGIHIPSDYTTKLTAMIAGNQAPDCGYLGIPTAYEWYGDGVLADISKIYSNDPNFSTDDLVDGALVYYDQNQVMGLFTAIEGYSVIYNTEVLKEAGITPPATHDEAWTWDEFVEVCKQLTVDINGKRANEAGFDPENIDRYGVTIPLWFGTYEAIFMKNNGVYVTDQGTTGWVEPEVIEVLQALQDLMYVHHVMPTPIARQGLPGTSISLQTGKYAMTLTGQWDLNSFAQVEGLNVDLTPVPTFGKNDTMLIGSGEMAIYTDGDNKEGAWELIKYLTTPENSLELYSDGLWMPIYKEYYLDEEKIALWTSNEKARPAAYKEVMMLPVLNKGRYLSELFVKNFNDMHNLINPALDQVWSGEVSPEEAMGGIEEELNKLIDGTYGKIKN